MLASLLASHLFVPLLFFFPSLPHHRERSSLLRVRLTACSQLFALPCLAFVLPLAFAALSASSSCSFPSLHAHTHTPTCARACLGPGPGPGPGLAWPLLLPCSLLPFLLWQVNKVGVKKKRLISLHTRLRVLRSFNKSMNYKDISFSEVVRLERLFDDERSALQVANTHARTHARTEMREKMSETKTQHAHTKVNQRRGTATTHPIHSLRVRGGEKSSGVCAAEE